MFRPVMFRPARMTGGQKVLFPAFQSRYNTSPSSPVPPPPEKSETPITPIADLARSVIPPTGTTTPGPTAKQVLSSKPATPAPVTPSTEEPSTPIKPIGVFTALRKSRFTNTLKTRPLSTTLTFLLLHEVTAVIPLAVITGLLQWTDPIPLSSISSGLAETFREGLDMTSLWFARNDLFGFSLAQDGTIIGREAWGVWAGEGGDGAKGEISEEALKRYTLVSHVALAWAITKVILPLRIWATAYLTPGVVGWGESLGNWVNHIRYKRKVKVLKKKIEEELAEQEEEAQLAKKKVVKTKVVRGPDGIPRREIDQE